MATGKETDEVIGERESTSTSTAKGEAIALPYAVLFSRSDGASVRASNTCDVVSLGKNDCSGNVSEESKTSPLPPFKSGGETQCNSYTLTDLKRYLHNRNKVIETKPIQCTNLPNIEDLIDGNIACEPEPEPASNPMVREKLRAKGTRCSANKQTDDVNYSFSSAAFPLQSGCFSSVPVSSDNDYCTPDTSSNAPCTDHGTSPQISRPENEAAILSLTQKKNLVTSPTNSITFHDESYDDGTSTQINIKSRRKPKKRHPDKLEPDLPLAKKPNLVLQELTITDDDFL